METFNCTGSSLVAGRSLSFDYDRYKFADGSVLTNCAVRDPGGIYSNTFMYKKDQGGAAVGYCALVYDVDASTSGFWAFESAQSSTGATYADSASSWNGARVALTCSSH